VTDARQEPAHLTVARDLRDIADHWPALLTRLAKQGQRTEGGGKVKPGSALPIDAHVSTVKGEVEDWLMFLTRCLMDESNWQPPPDISTPGLLRHIATWRIGHFTDHPDEMLAQAITDDADHYAHLVRKTANPSGVRKIPLHVACLEHATDDQGARVPCPGEYHTMLIPDRDIQDMVCSEDSTHRMSPWEWARGLRRGTIAQRDRMEGLGA